MDDKGEHVHKSIKDGGDAAGSGIRQMGNPSSEEVGRNPIEGKKTFLASKTKDWSKPRTAMTAKEILERISCA